MSAKKVSIVAALATVLLSACQPTGTWVGNPDDPTVVVIGDSLTFQADGGSFTSDPQPHHITADLNASGSYAFVDGLIGRQTSEAPTVLDYATSALDTDPDAVVVALGSNDQTVIDGAPNVALSDSEANLTALLDAAGGACVRFIGIRADAYDWWAELDAAEFNAMLVDLAASRPDAAYVEWAPPSGWFEPTPGDVHFGRETVGADAYRALIVEAAESCLDAD